MKPISKLRIATVGDLVTDIYASEGQVLLGGAAFNAALQVHKAGAMASIVSAVGTDQYGEMFLTALRSSQVNTDYLAVIPGKTSQVKIELDSEGKPTYSDWEPGALSAFRIDEACEGFLRQHDAARIVCYKQMESIFGRFDELDLPNTLKVGDFGGTSEHTYEIYQINQYVDGFDIIVRSIDQTDRDGLEFLGGIAYDFQKLVIALVGKAGSVAFYNGERYVEPVAAIEAKNTTGAGDAYLAHFIVTFLQTRSVEEAMRQGTRGAVQFILERNGMFTSFQ